MSGHDAHAGVDHGTAHPDPSHVPADGTSHAGAHRAVRGGAAVLDIGGDIGALVVHTDEHAAGTELHLRADGDIGPSIHTGVWRRQQGNGSVTAALFLALTEGTWWVLDDDGADVLSVDITGGQLATADVRPAQGDAVGAS